MAGPDIDLNGRQDQARHAQGFVACYAALAKLFLTDAVVHMDIVVFLVLNRALKMGLPSFRRVVVAHEQDSVCGQGQQALDGFIELAGAAARKVATGSTDIGQKQGVTHKYAQPLNVIGHIGRCVAGYVQGLYLKDTDLELLLILEQRIEGCAVGLDFGLYIEDATERGLHLLDVLADGDFAAHLFLQPDRSGQMVGMGVGFQNPLHLQLMLAHKIHDLLG